MRNALAFLIRASAHKNMMAQIQNISRRAKLIISITGFLALPNFIIEVAVFVSTGDIALDFKK